MFQLNEDMSIYVTRGDIMFFTLYADNGGINHKFNPGDVVRFAVYGKKDAKTVVLQKDFPVEDYTEKVEIYLTKHDTKIGESISKPMDYWYEIVLNPFDEEQTIVGYDEDGPKLFRLFPEAEEIIEPAPAPKDIPIVDQELDMTSTRPVGNQAISRAYQELRAGYERTHAAVAKLHVTPQMFGAIGDGEADDTEAIQAALDSFVGKVGDVFLPQGQYKITAPLVIKSNINLFGVSSAKYGRYDSDIPSTVIFYGGDEVIESVIKYDRDGATVFGGSIYNLSIDGQEKANYIINLSKSGRVTITNNSIVKSLKSGIYASSVYENIIKENWFGYNKEYAINLNSYANANTVRDNAIELSNESSGILLSGCNGNVISGNMIEGGYGDSIGVKFAPVSFTTQNIVCDNRIEFESHRYEGQTEGICILIGEADKEIKPNRNYVQRNAVFNQVVLEKGDTTKYNYKNTFVDYGLSTVTDFYDNTVLNENTKMVVSNGALEKYGYVDDGFSFARTDGGAKITLTNAIYEHPVVYQAVNAKDLRGENIALSCMMKCSDRAISVGIEYYKGGTGNTWGNFGTYITAKRAFPFDVGVYMLLQVIDQVPEDCDTAVITFNFGANGTIPDDTNINVKWCKLTSVPTWK